MDFIVCTYNIHSWIGRGQRFNPQLTLEVLGEIGADVYALQEFHSSTSDSEDMVTWIGRETGLHPIPGPTLLRQEGAYGNLMLTRSPPNNIQRVDISVPGREPRGVLDVRLRGVPHPTRIVTTHLGLEPAERRTQMMSVLKLFKEPSQGITILMGDLNEWLLWGKPLRWLRNWFGPTPGPATFPARFPLFALDRIWVYPRQALGMVKVHDSPLARKASDHLPLKAFIRFPGSA